MKPWFKLIIDGFEIRSADVTRHYYDLHGNGRGNFKFKNNGNYDLLYNHLKKKLNQKIGLRYVNNERNERLDQYTLTHLDLKNEVITVIVVKNPDPV